MQGKQVDAMVELSKICLLLRIFPPEESLVCLLVYWIVDFTLNYIPLVYDGDELVIWIYNYAYNQKQNAKSNATQL